MPGTSLVFSSRGLTPSDHSNRLTSRERMLHYPSYAASAVYEDRYLALDRTGYEGYPYRVVADDPDHLVVLEGRIYNKAEEALDSELEAIRNAIDDRSVLADRVGSLAETSDGEYLVVIYDKKRSRLVVCNDVLGRLPLYCYHDASRFIVSREVKYIVTFLVAPRFDRRGVMEYLLYGSPLGQSTLIEDIRSVRGGAWMVIDREGKPYLGQRAHSALEGTGVSAGSKADLAERIGCSFLDVLGHRARATAGSRPVLSLSGGLDSRAVLAGLCRLDHHPLAVTASGPEESSARAVAKTFGVDIKVVGASHSPTGEDYRRFSFLKDGLDCHPGLPGLYAFMEKLLEVCGRGLTYYTGIMGGEVTRHYNVTGGLGTADKVVRHVLSSKAYYKCPTKLVAALVGMSEREVSASMLDLIEEFPETKPARKYLAFRYELYRRYTGEAEDRNRFYCWTVSPFYSWSFFRLMSSIPEHQKGLRLWRDVLRFLDPRACKDPYFNRGLSLENDFALGLVTAVERTIRIAPLKNLAQSLEHRIWALVALMKPAPDSGLREELLQALGSKGTFGEGAARILGHGKGMLGLERVFTLCGYADEAEIPVEF